MARLPRVPNAPCLLEALRLQSARYEILSTHADDAQVRAEPFDAIALDLGALWADLAGE